MRQHLVRPNHLTAVCFHVLSRGTRQSSILALNKTLGSRWGLPISSPLGQWHWPQGSPSRKDRKELPIEPPHWPYVLMPRAQSAAPIGAAACRAAGERLIRPGLLLAGALACAPA